MIARIRKGRKLGSKEEVRILPTDTEWDMIMGTQYYQKMPQVMDKPVQKILLRNQDRTSWPEEDEKEPEFQAAIAVELADRVSVAMGDYGATYARF
ncbi:hypothetical protein Cpir12675_000561 [Ceratocystis pirilliformis]|uniref:Uncharacterized protein n=1 Tax=Ceratocystis pirilliformis TaxID=259994 RepID=A0ABR3ZKI1_9PEZI